MRRLLILFVVIATVLLLTPPLSKAQGAQSASGSPPVAQPLVREGDFATRLVEVVNLGPAKSEADAESILAAAGIAPRNGWVSDYPLTPDIVAELQTSIRTASDSGRLAMSGDSAVSAFEGLKTEFGLTFTADSSGAYGAYGSTAPPTDCSSYCDSAAVDQYYADSGPPAVTYYAPPPDYYYLYDWVPYPFWWGGLWFGGFFALNDFDIVFFDHDHHHHHDHDGHHDGFHDGHHGSKEITNHVRDSRTGSTRMINASTRASGQTFHTVSSMPRTNGVTTASANRGARSIMSASSQRFNSSHGVSLTSHSGSFNSARSMGNRGGASFNSRSLSSGGGRSHSMNTFNSSRSFSSSPNIGRSGFSGGAGRSSFSSGGFSRGYSGGGMSRGFSSSGFSGGGFHGGGFSGGGFHGGGGGGFHGGGGGHR